VAKITHTENVPVNNHLFHQPLPNQTTPVLKTQAHPCTNVLTNMQCKKCQKTGSAWVIYPPVSCNIHPSPPALGISTPQNLLSLVQGILPLLDPSQEKKWVHS
jgi:hypothetical protein